MVWKDLSVSNLCGFMHFSALLSRAPIHMYPHPEILAQLTVNRIVNGSKITPVN